MSKADGDGLIEVSPAEALLYREALSPMVHALCERLAAEKFPHSTMVDVARLLLTYRAAIVENGATGEASKGAVAAQLSLLVDLLRANGDIDGGQP